MFIKAKIASTSILLSLFGLLVLFVFYSPFLKSIRKTFEKDENSRLEWHRKPPFISATTAVKDAWIRTDKGRNHHHIESPKATFELEGPETLPHLVEYLDQMRLWAGDTTDKDKPPTIKFLRSKQGVFNYETYSLYATESFISVYQSNEPLYTTKPSTDQLYMSGLADGIEINLDSDTPKIFIKGFKAHLKKPQGSI